MDEVLKKIEVGSDFKEVEQVNLLISKGDTSIDVVIERAIFTMNPRIMMIIRDNIKGISLEQVEMLNEAIKNCLHNSKSQKNNQRNLKSKSLKRSARVKKIVDNYLDKPINELIKFSEINMHASKDSVRILNYFIHRDLKTVDDIVNEAIASLDARVIYYVARFVDEINQVHLQKLCYAISRCEDMVMMLNFANTISGLNLMPIAKIFVNVKYFSGILSLAKVPGAPLEYLGSNLIELANKKLEAQDVYYFIRDHYADLTLEFVDKASRKIMKLKNPSVICKLATDGYSRISIDEFAYALRESINEEEIIYYYIFLKDNYTKLQLDTLVILLDDLKHRKALLKKVEVIYYILRDCNIELEYVFDLIMILKELAMESTESMSNYYLVDLASKEGNYQELAIESLIEIGNAKDLMFVYNQVKSLPLKVKIYDAIKRLSKSEENTLGVH